MKIIFILLAGADLVAVRTAHNTLANLFLQFDQWCTLLNEQRYISDLLAPYMVEVQPSDVCVATVHAWVLRLVLSNIRLKYCTPLCLCVLSLLDHHLVIVGVVIVTRLLLARPALGLQLIWSCAVAIVKMSSLVAIAFEASLGRCLHQ